MLALVVFGIIAFNWIVLEVLYRKYCKPQTRLNRNAIKTGLEQKDEESKSKIRTWSCMEKKEDLQDSRLSIAIEKPWASTSSAQVQTDVHSASRTIPPGKVWSDRQGVFE